MTSLCYRPALSHEHLTSDHITDDRVITMPFAPCILINTQKLRSVERLLLIQVQSFSFEFLERHSVETLLHKAGTNSGARGDMRDRLGAGQLTDLFAQTGGRLPSPATRRIGFRKGFSTPQTAKAAFEHDQFDSMLSQHPISFLSGSRIMNFDALLVTMRAGGLGRGCHHLYSDRPISEPLLGHNMELGQV